MVLKKEDGKYVLVKDPNKNVLRLYAVPTETFEEEEVVPEKPEDSDGDADEE